MTVSRLLDPIDEVLTLAAEYEAACRDGLDFRGRHAVLLRATTALHELPLSRQLEFQARFQAVEQSDVWEAMVERLRGST